MINCSPDYSIYSSEPVRTVPTFVLAFVPFMQAFTLADGIGKPSVTCARAGVLVRYNVALVVECLPGNLQWLTKTTRVQFTCYKYKQLKCVEGTC